MMKKIRFYRFIIYLLLLIFIYSVPLEWIDNQRLCIWYHLFNLDCLGCGFTRAFFHFMHAQFYEAFAYNKMILFLPMVWIVIIQDSWLIIQQSHQLSWIESSLIKFINWVYPKRD